MRFLKHLYEAPEDDSDDKDGEKSAKEIADDDQEERDKAIERFLTMILAASNPAMMNAIVDQVAPLYVRWGDEWLNKFDDALKEVVADRLREQMVKIIKQKSIRFHHIKNAKTGKASDDSSSTKDKNKNPNKEGDK